MSTSNPQKKPKRTTMLLPDIPEMKQSARRVSHNALLRLFSHLSKPVHTSAAPPTEGQRQLVVTGFILGILSILTSFFLVCGLLTSLFGLLIGTNGRRSHALRTMATWTITLSLVGLALSILFFIVLHK
jgi:hypothetical protein